MAEDETQPGNGGADDDSETSSGGGNEDTETGDGAADGDSDSDNGRADSGSTGEVADSSAGQGANDSGDLDTAQNDADENMSSSPVGAGVEPCGSEPWDGSSTSGEEVSPKKKSWIAIKLLDQNGRPVPDEEYRIILPDGSPVEGDLDKRGFARLNGIDPGTCQITFPNLDKSTWHKK